MVESIAIIIFLVSLLGIALVLFFKAPTVITLPKDSISDIKRSKIVSGAENRIRKVTSLFSDRIVLHKFLSWAKCRVIKIETWIDEMLHGIRKKAKEDKLNGKR